MRFYTVFKRLSILTIFFILCTAVTATAADYKVLVVMSYETDYPWCVDIREGIERVLGDAADIRYLYMDTKTDLDGGPDKAKEAYGLFESLKPDGVIAVDDNAQSMFVVPFLKNKVDVPVMFCGVNADPAAYGYPADNVSGILERYHIKESIALAQQLSPSVRKVGFILKDSPAGKAIIQQIEKDRDAFTAEVAGITEPKTLAEALARVDDFKSECDALYMTVWQGIPGTDGNAMTDKQVMPLIVERFDNPTIGAVAFQVRAGALCAVVQTGGEQGETAAEMLLQAMSGTPVSQIPITRNMNGKRMINVMEMRRLGIKPNPSVIRGTELVRTDS
jgi:ABC-type uncharacterized transport system substrate-binding protein